MNDGTERTPAPKVVVFGVLAILLSLPHVLFLFQPFFMDERAILQNVHHFFTELTVIPVHAKYPTFYSYLAAPLVASGAALSFMLGDYETLKEAVAFLDATEPLTLIMPARIMTLALLVVSGVVLLRFCSSRFGAFSGRFVFLILMASPAFMKYGSFGLPDIAVLLFTAVSLVLVAKFLESFGSERSTKLLMAAAVFSGVAISTKYNALSSVVPVGFSFFYLFLTKKESLKGAIRMAAGSAVACIVAFLLASPGWILKPRLFASGFLWEMEHAKRGHMGTSGIPVLGNLELLVAGAPVIFIAGLVGFVLWMRKRDDLGWIAAVSIVSSIALASTSTKQGLHYMYPAFAGLLFYAAVLGRRLERMNRAAVGVVVGLALLIPVFNACQKGSGYLNENTTVITSRWMYDNIAAGSKVARDWAYVPELYTHDDLDALREEQIARIAEHVANTHRAYSIETFTPAVEWLSESDAEYFVTSEFVYNRFYKSGLFSRTRPSANTALLERFRTRKAFYDELFVSTTWDEVFSVDTGNGPLTHVYRRRR